ncbi:hypothetical protein IT575_00130 [bacterium]|nr:hypothetical protein [bacterium]
MPEHEAEPEAELQAEAAVEAALATAAGSEEAEGSFESEPESEPEPEPELEPGPEAELSITFGAGDQQPQTQAALIAESHTEAPLSDPQLAALFESNGSALHKSAPVEEAAAEAESFIQAEPEAEQIDAFMESQTEDLETEASFEPVAETLAEQVEEPLAQQPAEELSEIQTAAQADDAPEQAEVQLAAALADEAPELETQAEGELVFVEIVGSIEPGPVAALEAVAVPEFSAEDFDEPEQPELPLAEPVYAEAAQAETVQADTVQAEAVQAETALAEQWHAEEAELFYRIEAAPAFFAEVSPVEAGQPAADADAGTFKLDAGEEMHTPAPSTAEAPMVFGIRVEAKAKQPPLLSVGLDDTPVDKLPDVPFVQKHEIPRAVRDLDAEYEDEAGQVKKTAQYEQPYRPKSKSKEEETSLAAGKLERPKPSEVVIMPDEVERQNRKGRLSHWFQQLTSNRPRA